MITIYPERLSSEGISVAITNSEIEFSVSASNNESLNEVFKAIANVDNIDEDTAEKITNMVIGEYNMSILLPCILENDT